MKLVSTVIIFISLLTSSLLYASSGKLSSNHSIDIDRDNKKETITYSIKKTKSGYDASLFIKTKENNVLWSHEYTMSENDLIGDLLMNEGNISLEHWVKHFFDGSLVYGAKFEQYKIKKEEINLEFLEFYSKKLKHTANELSKLILSSKINNVFYYRASWREELIMLVYIPKLKKLVHFSGGEY